MNHIVVSMLSAIGGVIALAVALQSGELVGLVGLLALILLLNALARYMLARL